MWWQRSSPDNPEIKIAIMHEHRVYNKYVKRGPGVNLTDGRMSVWYATKLQQWLQMPKIIASLFLVVNYLSRQLVWKHIGQHLTKSSTIKGDQHTSSTWEWNICHKLSNKNIFNDLLAQQRSLNINYSVLPDSLSKCDNSLDDNEIDPAKVLTIIRSSDPNKAHGCDNIYDKNLWCSYC